MNAAAVRLSLDAATQLCAGAARRIGACEATALSLARASVAAEARGQPNLGLSHFVDYLEAIVAGRIDGQVEPLLTRPAPAVILSDAGKGAAHPGYDRAHDEMVAAARRFGLALFAQRNSYTCGALGYFTERLAGEGLVALAATNGPALMAGSGGTRRVFCTNPLAFSAPAQDGIVTIDQASSATAFVNIRKAARDGRPIPEGWAVDAEGRPTTDAARAVKGALLAFGGERGANIALMVEILAAGVTGANWSVDAPSFTSGAENPGTGMLVLALLPDLVAPDFSGRLSAYVTRLEQEFGVYVPGRSRRAAAAEAREHGITIPRDLFERLSR